MSGSTHEARIGGRSTAPDRPKAPRGLPPLWATTLLVFSIFPFTTGPCGPVSGAEYVEKAVGIDPRGASPAAWWVVGAAICIVAGTVIAFVRSRWGRVACAALSAIALACIVGFALTFGWERSGQTSMGPGSVLTGILLGLSGMVNGARASERGAIRPRPAESDTVADRFTMTS